jgi:hypothetical protein
MDIDENKLKYVLGMCNNDYSMAKLIHYLYSDIYCITNDGKRDKWFAWNGVHWHTSEMIKHELKIKLSEEVPKLISRARTKIRNELANATKDERLFEENRMKSLTQMEQKFYSTTSKDRIIKECESLFFVNELPKK